jgi:hypothetical protein
MSKFFVQDIAGVTRLVDNDKIARPSGGSTGCCTPKLQNEIVRAVGALPAPKLDVDIVVYLVTLEADGTVSTPPLSGVKIKQEVWVMNFGNADVEVTLDAAAGTTINGKTSTWVVIPRWCAVLLRKISATAWVGVQGLAPP